MQSENIEKVYSALRAVGKELNIPDEQWQETVIDPVRERDTPANWKPKKPKKSKKPKVTIQKGNLHTHAAREVVIFAPQCAAVDREGPEEIPSAARDITFGHLTIDREAGPAPWIRAIFHCGTQMPCIELKVDIGTPEEPRKGHVFIFGTNLTRAGGVLPIEMHTGRTAEIEEYAYDHMASPQIQLEQPQLCRPDLYEEIRAKKVTCIDVKLLGGPNDKTDIEGRHARLRFADRVTTREYQQWAKDAATASVHMTEAQRFLGLLYAGTLRLFKIYYTYRHKIAEAEYPEHAQFCKYFQSVMLFASASATSGSSVSKSMRRIGSHQSFPLA